MRRHIRMVGQVSSLLVTSPYICFSCLRAISNPPCNTAIHQLRFANSAASTQANSDIGGTDVSNTVSYSDRLDSTHLDSVRVVPAKGAPSSSKNSRKAEKGKIRRAKDVKQPVSENLKGQAVLPKSRARGIRTRKARHNHMPKNALLPTRISASNKISEVLSSSTDESLVNRCSKSLKASKESQNVSEEEPIKTKDVNRHPHCDFSSETGGKVTLHRTPTSNQRKSSNTAQKQDHIKMLSKSSLKKNGMTAYEIETIKTEDLELIPLDKCNPPIPSLSYGLERVLFNPGVYHLRDPRSRVFNFDPYLQSIMPVGEFDFGALKKYVTSSQDETLASTAASQNKKYSGSTSSMTSVLGHFHFLLSHWRPLNISKLSQGFPEGLVSFTNILRAPTAIFLRWKDGTYAIDADKEFDSANILMMLGRSMEKLLTLPTTDFEKYRKENSDQITEAERNEPESFHYTAMGDFLLRSQLDAQDPRLPGTGVFDLKTRAVLPIRMDAANYQDGAGYEIRSLHGRFESYEREYYDMMRSAFLKYSLQVRMGRMDGIFVAFHNTMRIFGFQYISLPELDEALHGQSDVALGDSEFKLSLELLNRVLDRATKKFPKRSLRLFFETRETSAPFMYIFAEPVTDDDIKRIQDSKKAEIEEWEQNVLGLDPDRPQDLQDETKTGWENLQAKVEETVESDELGISEGSDSLEDKNSFISSDKFPGSNLLDRAQDDWSEHVSDKESEAQDSAQTVDKSEDEKKLENVGFAKESFKTLTEFFAGTYETTPNITQDQPEISSPDDMEISTKAESREAYIQTSMEKQILAMTLTVRNKVNNVYVPRPVSFKATDKWSVEYAVAEVTGQERSHNLYRKAQMRRAKIFKKTSLDAHFGRTLRRISKAGRSWRQNQDKIDQVEPIKVLDDLSFSTNGERSTDDR